MDSAEHRYEAEALIKQGCDYGCPHAGCSHELAYLLRALVHATLSATSPPSVR